MPRRRKQPLHHSVKLALGYDLSDSDEMVVEDWSARKRRVCKPCWELKYCPYGPLVEQAPLLPVEREDMNEHIKYIRECLSSNLVGSLESLTDDNRERYTSYLEDDKTILQQALFELQRQKRLLEASKLDSENEQLEAWVGGDLPPIHIYRVSFAIENKEVRKDQFTQDEWSEIEKKAAEIRNRYEEGLKKGVMDNRTVLDGAQRAYFRSIVDKFDPNDHPASIPRTFDEGRCNVFGHICPVFFAAEAMTETQEARRIGRHQISFTTMMRIVRRDDYRCQHCKKQLRDDEVEFDHIIPISKGGSSEEHNLRLTCFGCNRDKSDDYVP